MGRRYRNTLIIIAPFAFIFGMWIGTRLDEVAGFYVAWGLILFGIVGGAVLLYLKEKGWW